MKGESAVPSPLYGASTLDNLPDSMSEPFFASESPIVARRRQAHGRHPESWIEEPVSEPKGGAALSEARTANLNALKLHDVYVVVYLWRLSVYSFRS